MSGSGTPAPPSHAFLDDYYESNHDISDLVGEWSSLRKESNERAEVQFTTLLNSNALVFSYDGLPLHSSLSCSPSTYRVRSGSAKQQARRKEPRHSKALETFYQTRRSGDGEAQSLTPVALGYSTSMSASPAPGRSSSPSRGTSSVSMSTSSGVDSASSAYKRHHRYDRTAGSLALTTNDSYGRATEVRRQEKFLEESRRLGKPFVPSSRSPLDKPTRLMLGDCVRALYRTIAVDWKEAEPMIISTAEDLIVIFFSLHSLHQKEVTVLLRYMNAALKLNPAIKEFHLSKVAEGWDVLTKDGHAMYTLRPPWVKKIPFLPHTMEPPRAHEGSS